MGGDEDYVTVSAILRARTSRGVKLSPHADPDHSAWIGRSCLHGADNLEINACKIGDELDVRMFEWVARRENLI